MKCIDCMKKYKPNNFSEITLNQEKEKSKNEEFRKEIINETIIV